MDNPEVIYDTPKQMLAIQKKDSELYPHLSSCNHADFKTGRPDREQLCHFVYIYPAYVPPGSGTYHQRSETLPFTRNDLQAFFNEGINKFQGGYWSVYWASDARPSNRDTIHPDGYRSVVSFRTIEFMIRPMPDYKNRSDDDESAEPKRLYIGWLDVKACLSKALEADRPGPMRTFTGTAHMNHPDRDGTREAMVGRAKITFEWRIDRVLQETMDAIVRTWRYDAFGKAEKYHDKVKEAYDKGARETINQQLQARDAATTQPGALFQGYSPPGQPQQGPSQFPLIAVHHRGNARRGKRRSTDMSASLELSPSSKRRSIGSQSSSSSQSQFATQSLTASPDMGSQTPVGGWPRTTMPPPSNPRWSVGSQSSRSSQSGLASSPEMGRQPQAGAWPQAIMPPPRNLQYAQPSYPDPSYVPSLPAASPRLGQPYTPVPMPHVPAQGWQSSHGHPGGASTGHWGYTAPSYGSYAPDTGNYPPAVPGAVPAMPQHQGETPSTWASPAFPSLAIAPPVSSIAVAPPVSVAMAPQGTNVYQSQDPPPSSQPGWWDEAGLYMHSNQPHGGNQSGYESQYGGGRGSGQR